MEIPTEQDIVDKLMLVKTFIKSQDLQMGISYKKERIIINKINEIIRIAKHPMRKVKFDLRKSIFKTMYSRKPTRKMEDYSG